MTQQKSAAAMEQSPGQTLTPGSGYRLSLSQCLIRNARLYGQSVVIVDGERRVTWNELHERVARLGAALSTLAVTTDVRVSILSNNSHRFLETLFAVPWAGGIFAPLNWRLAVPELLSVLEDSGAKILIVDDANLDTARSIAAKYPLTHLIHAGDGPAPDGMLSFEALIAAHAPSIDAGRCGDDIAGLYYTGGSTGRSKGVMHTHANLVTSAIVFAAGVSLSDQSAGMVPGPMFHVNALGSAIPIMVCGGKVVLMPRFEPGEVLRVIEREKTTVMSLLPTILRMMVDHPDARTRDLTSMASILYGAAPMPEQLIVDAGKVFPNTDFKHCYGMTETTASVTTLPTRYVMPETRELGKWRSAGRALMGMDLAIVDVDDKILPARAHGEIVVRGPLIMKGYWNQPELTATTLRNGWMHTGDLGYMDEDGFVYIVDRLKDMIKSGGENVFSAEVEAAVYAYPGVAQCAVIGIPDEKWGEAVHAIVSPSPGATLESSAIIEHCRTLIARYKCPRSVEVRHTPLPLTGVNKINKPVLRAPFWDGHKGTI